ncbi:MAG: cobalt ECF transporter T component CbiQ [Candidatus Aminicenantes bacterium]|nr:cobalt ECF transporter T component CbiQ [Candidatus Aminicenantes bacterium]MDH5714373.1 cobalt ECF transporter T component CbiQ [Candidatus Aminicenantes bacterium]
MKHSYLDRYSNLNSPIHRADPRLKILVALFFVLSILLTNSGNLLEFALYGLIIASLVIISRIPPLFILKRSLMIIPFIVLISLFLLFDRTGLSAEYSGKVLFRGIVIKSYLAIVMLTLLSSTSTFPSLLQGLQRLKISKVFILLLSFMYRYIFILVDEAMRITRGKRSREFGAGKWRQIKSTASLIGILFIRTYERGERVYSAMCSRGFDGTIRTLNTIRLRMAEILVGFALVTIIILVKIFTHSHAL